jgi:hypothetical protein
MVEETAVPGWGGGFRAVAILLRLHFGVPDMWLGADMGHAADNGLSERVVVCHIVAVGFSYLCGCNSNHTDYGTEH